MAQSHSPPASSVEKIRVSGPFRAGGPPLHRLEIEKEKRIGRVAPGIIFGLPSTQGLPPKIVAGARRSFQVTSIPLLQSRFFRKRQRLPLNSSSISRRESAPSASGPSHARLCHDSGGSRVERSAALRSGLAEVLYRRAVHMEVFGNALLV
jgi:hypothetical protein